MSKKNRPPHSKSSTHSGNGAKSRTLKLPHVPKSFEITIKMLSDWHIGSGTGRPGDVDRLVQRDGEGLPYLPAKTITGVWRDACELVAAGLDEALEQKVWGSWVEALFGSQPALAKGIVEESPSVAALSVRAAHLPESLRLALQAQPALLEALTFIKPGISIDPASGTTRKDYLRFEEMVRGGAVLKASCELQLGKTIGQQRAAYALLVAGSLLVERLGAKRRRGAGRCQMNLVSPPEAKGWLQWLEGCAVPEAPPKLSAAPPLPSTPALQVAQETDWFRIPLALTLRLPVVMSARTKGNVVETLDYIPGTHLLPIVVRRLGTMGVNLSTAIGHGDLVITTATLEVGGEPGKPIPLCLFYEKLAGGFNKGQGIYNRIVEPEPSQQLKGYRQGYISSMPNSGLPLHQEVPRTITTHNTVDDQVQCPTSEVGGVYSYEAIEPGVLFRAELRLQGNLLRLLDSKAPRDKKDWWTVLAGDYRLGQAKKDEYGAISLKVLGKPTRIPPPETKAIEGDQLVVWLLSDVLLRDERLRPTTSSQALARELSKELGVTLEMARLEKDLLNQLARQRRTDSWQVRWERPRPSLVGLAAGSCFVFTVQGNLDPAKLAQVQAKGIGERRAEGYGQLCFNDPLLTTPTSNLQVNPEVQKTTVLRPPRLLSETDLSFRYARTIEREAWRQAVQRAALRKAASQQERQQLLGLRLVAQETGLLASQPPMSQLGSLRSVLGQLRQQSGRQQVASWLQNLERKDEKDPRWPPDSLAKIQTLILNPEQLWTELNLPYSQLTLTTPGEAALKDELWAEAVWTLVDTCVRAHKRDLEKPSTQPGA